MYSLRARGGSLVLLALLAAPTASTAQQSDEELVARIDALIPLVEQARVEAQAAAVEYEERARRLAESQGAVDTLHIYGMTVIAPTEDAALARGLFEAAWTEHFSMIESRTLQHSVFTFQKGREAREIFIDKSAEGGGRRDIRLAWWQSRKDASAVVTNAIEDAIARDIYDTNVGRWVSSAPLRVTDPGYVYRSMAMTPSQAVRRCLRGETGSCLVSLGLGDPSIATWYTPEERRHLIMTGDFHPGPMMIGPDLVARPREGHEEYAECMDDRRYEACDALLLADERRSWAPLPGSVRAALLGFALDRGGAGAWTRLVEMRDHPVEEALAYSAGVDLDALITEWRRWIVDNRPETYAGLGAKSVITALWILFFAGLAMRSTRWRLG